MNIKSLLMPLEEYPKQRLPDEHIYTIKTSDGRELYYFGVTHYRDPSNPIFSQIKTEFGKFNPDIVFVEGNNSLRTENRNRVIAKFKELEGDELIHLYGESGFLARLASEKGVYVDSPEPALGDQLQRYFKEGFTKDEIFTFYMIRFIQQRLRVPEPRPSVEKFALNKLKELERETGWSDFDFSITHLIQIGKEIWGEEFNIDGNNLGSLIHANPDESTGYKKTIINKIARVASEFRDEYMVGEIIKTLQKYRRLFVVYGFSHAIIQEPALRELLK